MSDSSTARFPLSVSFHTIDHDQRLEAISVFRGSSVRSVEIWELSFPKGESHLRNARQAFAAVGVEPRTVHADFGPDLDISSPDPVTRSLGLQAVTRAIDLAAGLGAQIVVMHPSSEPIDDDERDVRMEQAKLSIGSIAQVARDAGCRIALELLPRTCLGRTARELLHLLEDTKLDVAGVCLDTNHLMGRYEALPDVVRELGPRLIALHCSDYDGVDERHWPPMQGVVDWASFLQALCDAGFSGPINYEANFDGETPAERLASLEANYADLCALV